MGWQDAPEVKGGWESAPLVEAAPAGEQPSVIDRIAASPPARLLHDAVVNPLVGLSRFTPMGDSLASAYAPVDKAYEGALARNRNTPGYAKARTEADAVQAKRGSGLSDQVIAPLLPAMTGALGAPGGLDAMNANADAQQAAQSGYQQRHPALSMGAGLAGGLLMTPSAAAPAAGTSMFRAPLPAIPKSSVPAIADMKAAAKASYQAVDNSGVRVSNDALNKLGDSVVDSFGSRLDPVLHPDATAAFNRIAQYATEGKKGDKIATFQDLDNLRRVVADAAQSTKPADKAMARMMMDKIDDFVENLKPGDLDTSLQDELRAGLMSATSTKGQIGKQIKAIEQNKPGALAARGAAGKQTRDEYMALRDQLPAAEQARQDALHAFQSETDLINAGPQGTIDALNHARDMWSRASQAELIQKQIDKAGIKASANYSQSGFENALRQQFKSLALNDRAMARLTPEVREAVKDVAKGSPMGNLLRAVGKYAPHGPVATAAGMGLGYTLGGLGGATEGGLASLAVPLAGEMARAGATAKTLAAANRARDVAAVGRGVTLQAPPQMLQRPALPQTLPYGLPLLMSPQQQAQ